MKKILIIVLLLSNKNVFAQECIPVPVNFAKQIGSYIVSKDPKSIRANIATWKDLQPIYNYFKSTGTKNEITKDEMMEPVIQSHQNADSLIASLLTKGINLKNSIVRNDKFSLSTESELPEGYYLSDGSIIMSFGDSSVKVGYTFLYTKTSWKILKIDDAYSILYKGKYISDIGDEIPIEDIQLDSVTEDSNYIVHDTTALEVPQFANPEIQKFVYYYNNFMKETAMLENNLNNNPDKAEILSKKNQELAERMQEMAGKFDALTEPEKKKLSSFIQEVQERYISYSPVTITEDSITVTTRTTMPNAPKFTDPEVQKGVEEYTMLFKEAMAVYNSKDIAKIEMFSKKSQEIAIRMQPIVDKLSRSPEELKKFTDFMQKLAKNYSDSISATNNDTTNKKQGAKKKSPGTKKSSSIKTPAKSKSK